MQKKPQKKRSGFLPGFSPKHFAFHPEETTTQLLEKVILVDEKDKPIGEGEKMRVHREGKLHRSFSIFIFNSRGETLLQQRAQEKYHSGGLWSNACCGHPRPGEDTLQAARRRLQEEMGLDCELKELLQFTYKVKLDHDLWEHEFDHVFLGIYDGEVYPNPQEADGYDWVDQKTLLEEVRRYPDQYTAWFKIVLDRVLAAW
ncbi:MAG TPA: isopentenyl-diphosphate Delta-isomerase [Candidatus Paceibacterota bacterium]